MSLPVPSILDPLSLCVCKPVLFVSGICAPLLHVLAEQTQQPELFMLIGQLYGSDYINPIDLCNRLNAYIVPEAAVHAFLTFLFVINGYWLTIILNLPLVAFNAKKYVTCIAGLFQDVCL